MVTHARSDLRPLTAFMPSLKSLSRAQTLCRIATAILSVTASLALQSVAMSTFGLSFSWVTIPLALGLLTGALFSSKVVDLGPLKISALIWIDLIALFFIQTSVAIVPFAIAALVQSPQLSKQILYQCISRGWTGVGAFTLSLAPPNDPSYMQRAVKADQLGSIALLMFELNITQSGVLEVVEKETPQNHSLMHRCMVGALDQDLIEIFDRYLRFEGEGTYKALEILFENAKERVTQLNFPLDRGGSNESLKSLWGLFKAHIQKDHRDKWLHSGSPLARALLPHALLEDLKELGPDKVVISYEGFQSLIAYTKSHGHEEILLEVIDHLDEKVLCQVAGRPCCAEDITNQLPYMMKLIERIASVENISLEFWVNAGPGGCKALIQELEKPGREGLFLRTLTGIDPEKVAVFLGHLFAVPQEQFERYLQAGVSVDGSLFRTLVDIAGRLSKEERLLEVIQVLDDSDIKSIVESILIFNTPAGVVRELIARAASIQDAHLASWVEDAHRISANEAMSLLVEGLTHPGRDRLLRATCLELDRSRPTFMRKKEVVAAIAQMAAGPFAGLLRDAALNYPKEFVRLVRLPSIQKRMAELEAEAIVPILAHILASVGLNGGVQVKEARDLINTWMELPNFYRAFESEVYDKQFLLSLLAPLMKIGGMPRLFSAVFSGLIQHSEDVLEVIDKESDCYRLLEEALVKENYAFVDGWAKAGLPFKGRSHTDSLLHSMVELGNFAAVRHLIKLHVDTQVEDSDGKTPLQRACDKHSWQIATHLAACEPASKDQTKVFQQVIAQGLELNQQLDRLREDQHVKEAERNALDPDGFILTAIEAHGPLAATNLQRAGRADLAWSVDGWLRLTGVLNNVAIQEDRIRAELRGLESMIRILAHAGPVYRGGRANVVSDAIGAGLSASVVELLLQHGGSLFARDTNGHRPIDYAIERRWSDKELLQVLSDVGMSGIEGVREKRDHLSVRLWRMITESKYVKELDEKVIRLLEDHRAIYADASLWHSIVTAGIERGSDAIFEYLVAMLCENKRGLKPTKIALACMRYDRVSYLAKHGLASERDVLEVLKNGDLKGFEALNIKELPKGGLKALLSSTHNLEARFALLSEFLSGLKAPERPCRAVAAFLERTLPKKKREDGKSWLIPKDLKHYHNILLAAQPGTPCPQSEEELRAILHFAQEPLAAI